MINQSGIFFYIIKTYFFLLPCLILINDSIVSKIRFFLAFFILLVQLIQFKFPKKNEIVIPFSLLMLCTIIFAFRNESVQYITNIVIFLQFYYIFNSNSINLYKKSELLNLFIGGVLLAVIIGFVYMDVTGFIKGGTFTENIWAISNISIPTLLGILFMYIYYTRIKESHLLNSVQFVIALFIIVSLMFFLGKRSPILSIFFSIIIIKVTEQKKFLTSFFVGIILLYPFYSIPVLKILAPISESEIFMAIFERNYDLADIDQNGRVTRFLAAIEFFYNLDIINLFYYPKVIFLSNSEQHNHFHNLLLQLYYEKGAISVFSFYVIIVKSLTVKYTSGNSNILSFLKATVFFFIMVGANESMLMSRSLTEFCTLTFALICFGMSESISKLEFQVMVKKL